MLYTIKNDFLAVTVDSFGAQLTSVRSADGWEYMWQGEKYWEDHCPVLFPTCGNVPTRKYLVENKEYTLPIHGIAMYREFKLTEKADNKLVFTLTSDEKTLECYPFDFKFEVEFTLVEKTLKVRLIPTNSGNKVMPYMVGWHPGFNLWGDGAIEDFRVDFGTGKELPWHPIYPDKPISLYPVNHDLENHSYYLCEKEIYDNDTMIFANYPKAFSLKDASGYAKISMRVSPNLSYFCIWKEPFADARFICLEPWSNIFNSDGTTPDFNVRPMSRLAPGASESYDYEVDFN